jgi:hypothetical protein
MSRRWQARYFTGCTTREAVSADARPSVSASGIGSVDCFAGICRAASTRACHRSGSAAWRRDRPPRGPERPRHAGPGWILRSCPPATSSRCAAPGRPSSAATSTPPPRCSTPTYAGTARANPTPRAHSDPPPRRQTRLGEEPTRSAIKQLLVARPAAVPVFALRPVNGIHLRGERTGGPRGRVATRDTFRRDPLAGDGRRFRRCRRPRGARGNRAPVLAQPCGRGDLRGGPRPVIQPDAGRDLVAIAAA